MNKKIADLQKDLTKKDDQTSTQSIPLSKSLQASVVELSTRASSQCSAVTTLIARSIEAIEPAVVLNKTFELGCTGSALLAKPEASIN